MLDKRIVLRSYGLGQGLYDLVMRVDRVHMQSDDRFGLALDGLHLVHYIQIGLGILYLKALPSFSLDRLHVCPLGCHGLFYHLPV